MNKYKRNMILIDSELKAETLRKILAKSDSQEWQFFVVDPKEVKLTKNSLTDDEEFSLGYTRNVMLKQALATAENLLIVTDPDEAGEALGLYLAGSALKHSEAKVRRIRLNEITETQWYVAAATADLVHQPTAKSWWTREVMRAQTEQVLGSIFSKTTELPKAYLKDTKVGYLETAALNIIHKKELEVRKFRPGKRFIVECSVCKDTATAKSLVFTTYEQADLHRARIEKAQEDQSIEVEFVERKELAKIPRPYTTYSLMKTEAKKLGMESLALLSVAKSLYQKGLITYPETKSLSLNRKFADRLWKYARGQGKKVLKGPKNYSDYSKFEKQGEMIRPAELLEIDVSLSAREKALYQNIWDRTINTQLCPALMKIQSVDYTVDKGQTLLMSAEGRMLEIAGQGYEEIGQRLVPTTIRKLGTPQVVEIEAKVPERFRVASLYKALLEENFGSPKVALTTIENLEKGGLIEIEKDEIKLTYKGEFIISVLKVTAREMLADWNTSQVEEDIAAIAEGKLSPKQVLDEHLEALNRDWKRVDQLGSSRRTWVALKRTCPNCKSKEIESSIAEKILKRKCKSCRSEYCLRFDVSGYPRVMAWSDRHLDMANLFEDKADVEDSEEPEVIEVTEAPKENQNLEQIEDPTEGT